MIRPEDLQEAIAECRGERNPDARTCIKLAAFYIIQDHLYPDRGYSTAPENNFRGDTIGSYGDTDFLRAIAGKSPENVFLLMDELMESTLRLIHPRIYDGVMNALSER